MTATAPERHLTAVPSAPTAPMYDLGAEQLVLGAMMLSREDAHIVSDILTAADFYRPNNGRIYTAITGLMSRGEPHDPHAVNHVLTASGDIEKVGGASYLHDCQASVPLAAHAKYYANIIAAHARRRRLNVAGARIAQLAQTLERDVDDLIADAENEILTVTATSHREEPTSWAELAHAEMEAMEAIEQGNVPSGIRTGFTDLDRVLGVGMQPGQLITVAARPGVGKTVLTLDVARNVAFKQRRPVLYFSLEMPKREIRQRIMSATASVPLAFIREGKLSDSDWARIARAAGETGDAPLFVDDTSELTIGRFRSICRRHKMLHGDLGLVVVDYLQLLRADGAHDNEVSRITEISQGLKHAARELECPVMAAAQLNRMSEQRADKKPQMSDLRSSGSIEQDSDVVILIHRPDMHEKESPRSGEADFIVDKNRSGFRGEITVAAQMHMVRFVDMAIE